MKKKGKAISVASEERKIRVTNQELKTKLKWSLCFCKGLSKPKTPKSKISDGLYLSVAIGWDKDLENLSILHLFLVNYGYAFLKFVGQLLELPSVTTISQFYLPPLATVADRPTSNVYYRLTSDNPPFASVLPATNSVSQPLIATSDDRHQPTLKNINKNTFGI